MNKTDYFSQFIDEERWEVLREYYKKSTKGKASMATLAKECESSWFDSRAGDTPELFIEYSWPQLKSKRGYGKKKLELIIQILISNVDLEALIKGMPEIEEAPEQPEMEIEGWDDFPLNLSFFSARTKLVCESAAVNTPRGLIEWFDQAGENGVLSIGNSGRKTLEEIQLIHAGWKNSDINQLQQLLPLNDDATFTIKDCILGYYRNISKEKQRILVLRLVEGNTLQASGKVLNKTRERIRQIESQFIQIADEALAYFSDEKQALFEEWKESGALRATRDLVPEDENIFITTIKTCFERSDEGKKTIAGKEQAVESLIEEVCYQWSYYCDGLVVDSFLDDRPQGAHKEAFIDAVKSKDCFIYDEARDCLQPAKTLQKHAALACLKCSENVEWNGAEWLLELKKSKRFQEVDLPHLRHLYGNWKKDPAFQQFRVNFGEKEIIEAIEEEFFEAPVEGDKEVDDTEEGAIVETDLDERLEVIRKAAQKKPQSRRTNEAPAEENQKARELDLRMRSIIEEAQSLSSEDALLGFLNIADEEQEEILSLAREELSKPRRNAARFLRSYPALASYALTLAGAVGLKHESVGSSSFYRAWDASIGWSPAPTSRKKIARAYMAALRHLDLRVQSIFVDQELDWKGGCYLFHAAVLPHFIQPLESALKSVQRELPLPDPDEPQQIDEFAKLLSNRVERGQARLIAVLKSPVGALLVRRLVLWHITGDPELFPPFILSMLEEQKTAEQETIIKRPHIAFDLQEEALFLELPAQSNKITNSQSRWVVNGRAFRADATREPLRLSEITTPDTEDITVEIDGLLRKSKQGTSNLRKQTYSFTTGISQEQPFRIFREADGREVRVQARRGQVELTLGYKYLALLSDEIDIESAHFCDECELGQIVEFDMNIDSPALSINDGETEWTIKPKINPGAFVHRKDALAFKAKELIEDKDVSINYGSDFGLTIALPSGAESGAVVFDSKTSKGRMLHSDITAPASEDHLTLIDLSQQFTAWLSDLPATIHEIEIIVTPISRKPFRQSFWYWKGLQYVSQSGDMYCKDFPGGIETKGYQRKENRLEYTPGVSRRAELISEAEGLPKNFQLRIPKPGVDITISSNEGEVLETNPTQAIDILPSDTRTITFHHGGLAPIELTAAGTLIGKIDSERSSLSRSLGALAANHGKTGSIDARAVIPLIEELGKKITHWRTPKVFNRCEAVDNELGEYYWELSGLTSTGLQGIRVRLNELETNALDSAACSEVEIELPEHHEHVAETSIIEGLSVEVSLSFKGAYRFIFNHNRHSSIGQVHVVEMDCIITDSSGWQQLACNEGHGRLSDIRLLFKGHPPEEPNKSNLVHNVFWDDLSKIGFGHDLNIHIDQPELVERWLNTARWLVNYRYPKSVWEKYNFRLKALYHSVTRLAVTNNGAAYWWQNAAAGLEEHAKGKTLTATVAPCLLFGAAYAGSFPKLGDQPVEFLKDGDLITKCLSESSLVMEAQKGALNYVQSAFQESRIDPEFLGYFYSWQQLLQMQDVRLKGFSLLEWSSKLSTKIKHASFEGMADEFRLLDHNHYLECIRKLSERGKILDNIRGSETSHWLSPHISKLNQLGHHASGVLRQITGKPHEELWEPFESSELLLLEEDLRAIVLSLIKASAVLASAYASVNKGLITPEKAFEALKQDFGEDPNQSETRRFLILGSAPELIAYFFLFFTFTLEPTSKR